jgi:Rod binding domain-containing protein
MADMSDEQMAERMVVWKGVKMADQLARMMAV